MASTPEEFDTTKNDGGVALRCFGYTVAISGVLMVLILIAMNMFVPGFIVAAVLCGMAESRGRCGVSHIGELTKETKIGLRKHDTYGG